MNIAGNITADVAALWEFSGDRKALRKLVEGRLMPSWYDQVGVIDPDMPGEALVLQFGAAAVKRALSAIANESR